jgi:serine/threonine-protein kinase PknG
MPNVLPRPPGQKPVLSEDDPQPTSALRETPQTLSIEPPHDDAPVTQVEAAATQVHEPATQVQVPEQPEEKEESQPKETPHSTGSSSFPTGRRTSSSRASGRGRLGAGLVEVPVVPVKDPASAVLLDPAVSENKRFCSNCGAAVGRSKDGEPGPTEGDCAVCGTAFNFRPRLGRGDLVGGQYEVLGCLAYGGLGWIYLAKDHNVSDRWVVLKGMIDTGDATSMAAAVAERRFLAEVEHPNVVRIYNFVQHPDPTTGTLAGYIVMEFVGGQSLRQLALAHHRETGRAEPLPIGQVIAYGLEILPAIG